MTALDLAGSRVLVGTCSWTDATLVKETDWYPKKSMTAAERLAYYASRFPIVEVDSTYYFPPTPELSETWAERTPAGFTMNVKAWSLLTGHPTFPNSLWEDMQSAVPTEHRDKRRLYAHYLPDDALDEAFDRFRHSLLPLQRAGRLGAVLLQYPRWFGPKAENRQVLRDTVARLPGLRLCVEFRHARWLESNDCERTFELLEELGVSFVCVDEPAGFPSSMPPVVAVTSDLAVVRFHGRNTATWEDPEIQTAAERFRYRYKTDELREWLPRLHELAASAREVHVLMNNCYRDDAVINAAELAELLAGD
ncbi:MAG TPA: DUF72 domain-containing protein [Acidimicrobiales bacterium]|nr:DUF72 domain-containing protein [Acidimicrobiales bacterium]